MQSHMGMITSPPPEGRTFYIAHSTQTIENVQSPTPSKQRIQLMNYKAFLQPVGTGNMSMCIVHTSYQCTVIIFTKSATRVPID